VSFPRTSRAFFRTPVASSFHFLAQAVGDRETMPLTEAFILLSICIALAGGVVVLTPVPFESDRSHEAPLDSSLLLLASLPAATSLTRKILEEPAHHLLHLLHLLLPVVRHSLFSSPVSLGELGKRMDASAEVIVIVAGELAIHGVITGIYL